MEQVIVNANLTNHGQNGEITAQSPSTTHPMVMILSSLMMKKDDGADEFDDDSIEFLETNEENKTPPELLNVDSLNNEDNGVIESMGEQVMVEEDLPPNTADDPGADDDNKDTM